MVKRVAAVVATLALLGSGYVTADLLRDGWVEARAFSPERFRAAAVREDRGAMRHEAYAAIRHDALRGLTRREVLDLLGEPENRRREPLAYVWALGITPYPAAFREQLYLTVEFSGGRVVDASVD